MYAPASEEEVAAIFEKRVSGEMPSPEEQIKFKYAFLLFMGKEYHRLDWAMQLHYGVRRDNNTRIYKAISFREMEDDFGILPMPKYYETQDRYYHTVSHGNASFMFLPINIKNEELEKLGTFLSGLSELSKKKVTYEYREVQLRYRDARDSESEEMLEIIFDSRTFDLGAAFNWGNILDRYKTLDGSPSSNFQQVLTMAKAKLSETIKQFKE